MFRKIALAKILRYLISQLPPRLEFRFAIALPLSILFHSSSDLERTNPHMNLKLTYLPLQINWIIWALLHFHFLVMVEAPMLPKILHPPQPVFKSSPKYFAELLWCQLLILFFPLYFSRISVRPHLCSSSWRRTKRRI